MNETVKYNNDMNLLKFKGFTKVDMNILMVLCSKMKDKDVQEITLSFEKIKELSKFTSTDKKDFIKALDEMTDRLIKVNSKIITNGKIMKFILFPTFIIDEDNEILTIGVNKDFTFLLNDLNAFTIFELTEFVNLNSKYSKNLYRLLKQFRTTGKLLVNDVEEFKEKMDCPKAYSNKYFKDNILKPAMEELKPYFKDLNIEVKKAKKRGSPVVGYTFTFEAEQIKKNPITNGTLGQMATQQLKAQGKVQYTSKPVNHKFNQFPQREYTKEDYKNLEKRMLNKSIGNRSEQEQEEEQERMRKFREKYPNLYR